MQPETPEPELDAMPIAALEHLTGPSRGTVSLAGARNLNVILRPGRILAMSTEDQAVPGGELVARLRRLNGNFEILALDGRQIWVNGRPVQSRRLKHHDMIEFGEVGPMSRVCIYRNGQRGQVSLTNIFSDATAYVRSSRKPLAKRLAQVMVQVSERLLHDTTLLFRIGVILALIALGAIVYQQSRINTLLRQRIETSAAELEGFSRLLAQVRKEALTPVDLARLREELSGRMTTSAERLSELEARSTATVRVIAETRSSILFLQGAYVLRETATGRVMRHVVDKNGLLLVLPNGVPLLSLEGNGPAAERQFTGTGFVLADSRVIATSRHVGQPWLYDVNVKALLEQGLKPSVTKFIAYFSDSVEGAAVSLIRASKLADVAILRLNAPGRTIKGLRLAEGLPNPGAEVVLLGYPTGIRSMLAQAGPEFIKALEHEKQTDFWQVAARLAAAGRIVPLA
ncbi:MAG TPA: trypsin-like peptidase domain-containing protein, partial [Hyphomicrobiaceae bacterium]|nr:trypsin-like peptidase domain-containing protein [Hyphomicrobiaceae bacterium]